MNDEQFDHEEPTQDIELCPECNSPMVELHEMRGEVGMFEAFNQCPACGYSESENV
jgi:uncharacterized protein with PIN domain